MQAFYQAELRPDLMAEQPLKLLSWEIHFDEGHVLCN